MLSVLVTARITCAQDSNDVIIRGEKAKDTGYLFAFTEATKMYLFGDYSGAASLYTECLKFKPNSAAANYQLAEIYLKAGDITRAKKFSLAANHFDSENKWYTLQIAGIYEALNKRDSAVLMYKRLLDGSVRDITVYYQIASLLERDKNYVQALEYLDKIEGEIGPSRETLISKSRVFEGLGRAKDALQQLRLAVTGNEDDYVVYGMMAEHFRMHGKADSAECYYKKIYHDHQDDANVVFSYGEFLLTQERVGEARGVFIEAFGESEIDNSLKFRYLYNALQDEEQFKKVRPVLDTVVSVLLNRSPESLNVMSLYSDVNYRMGNYKASGDILRKIMVKDETNYKAWEQMLFCLSAMDQKDSVVTYGRKAIEKFENRPLPYLILASVYYMRDEYKTALPLLKKGEEYADSPPMKIEFFSLLAECYSKIENQELSDKYYENALKIDSINPGILNNYAYSLAVRGKNLEKAKIMSGYTIYNEPENSTYLDTYAWVLFKNNELQKACTTIKKALKTGGNRNAEILEHYGDILLKMGRTSKALKIWGEAIHYGDEKAKKALEEKLEDLKRKH